MQTSTLPAQPAVDSPAHRFATVCLFALPLSALSTSFGLSLLQLVMLLAVCGLARVGLARWYRLHWPQLAWLVTAFGGYFCYRWRALLTHKGAASLDGPLRMLFALSCVGFVAWLRPQIRYFWLGLCMGTIAACAIALVQRFYLHMERVEGYTHHPITFGDLALAMGVLSLCALPMWRASRLRVLPPLALLCGLVTSVLSASRGGWIALLLLAPLLLLAIGGKMGKMGKVIALAAAVGTALLVLAYAVPATGVAQRVQDAVSDVRLYASHQDATTSVGIRLELWKASWLMFEEHPWLGVGRDQFHAALQELAARGRLQQSPALTYSSSHNDALYFLATGGLLDFGFLLLLYGAPFALFMRALRSPVQAAHAPALAGLMLVLCFIGFGLTDVMFWLMMPKVFYVMMVGVLAGFCLQAEAASKNEMTNQEITRRLLQLMKPYRLRFIFAFLGMIGTASTEPMFPRVLSILFDDGFGHKPGFQMWTIPAAIIGIFMLRGFCTFSSAYFSNWVISRILNDLRRAMFDRLLRLPVARFHEESTGAILNTMIAEARQVVEMITNAFLSIVRDGLTVVILVVYLLYLNWRLTLVALILVPSMTVLVRLSSGRLRRLNRENQRITEEMTQVVEEAARGHQVIRVFAGEAYEKRRFEQRSQALLGFSRRITVAASSTVPISQLMSALAVSGVIVLALHQSQTNPDVTAGSFVDFITAMLLILAPMKRLAEVNGPLQRGMTAAESVFGLIDANTEDDPGHIHIDKARGHLRLEHVAFRYSEQNPHALVDVSLDIAAGETVALVGVSGGGKSTLVNLVTRFYAPNSGRIWLDDIAYADITLASLRRQIAMVSQNVVLFDDTLAANIAYGVEKVDAARLARAVQAAHLSEVVQNLPQGLESMIGENGMRLSGGQRQRVAIARAIYKDAPLLILDEATSALDTESERAVQAALDELMRGRTTLVIAHRLSTIERADRILVLEQGRIIESGKHQQLLEMGGAYANLYRLQFSKERAS